MKPIRKRGISDVIATVIIVAATVAIALIAVSYFTGIIGGSTKTERVQILPVSVICNDSGTWKLNIYVKNNGGAAATIKYIQINGIIVDSSQHVVPVGNITNFTINVTSKGIDFVPGSVYSVSITTEKGFQTTVDIQAVDKCS